MTRGKIKNTWVGARVDEDFKEEIEAYIDEVTDMTIGQLVRKAIEEYINNHKVQED